VDRLAVSMIEDRRTDFLARSLKNASQLSDLEENSFTLSWNVEAPVFNAESVISLSDRCIWREPTGWENCERFIEIATMLKQKYGSRLTDLIPTRDSGDSFYGDNLASLRFVAAARCKLADGN
jgi:hypothetical protein